MRAAALSLPRLSPFGRIVSFAASSGGLVSASQDFTAETPSPRDPVVVSSNDKRVTAPILLQGMSFTFGWDGGNCPPKVESISAKERLFHGPGSRSSCNLSGRKVVDDADRGAGSQNSDHVDLELEHGNERPYRQHKRRYVDRGPYRHFDFYTKRMHFGEFAKQY